MKKTIAGLLCFLLLLNLTVTTATGEDSGDYVQNLIRLKIIDADDVREDEYLTYTECFNFIMRAVGSNAVSDLENEWKYGGFKRLMGDRPEWQKEIICKMDFLIVLQEEWKDIDFDAYCTHESAVTYCVRAVVDIGGCVWSPAVYESTEATYRDAYRKGIIETADTADSGKPITRGEFFKMLNKTLYVEYMRGGYAGTWKERIIDHLTKPQPAPAPSYEERMSAFIAAAQPASEAEKSLAASKKAEDFGLLDEFPGEVDLNRSVTRAELAVIISRLMGYSYIGSSQFKDFDRSAWYGDDFSRVIYYRIIQGYNGYARPDDPVTREEAALMLSRAFKLENISGLSGGQNEHVSFARVFSVLSGLIDVYYTLPRVYDNRQAVINGNVFIMSPDTVLKNTVINGNLYIAPQVCNKLNDMLDQKKKPASGGRLVLDNVTVNGDIVLPDIGGEMFYLIDCYAKGVKWMRDDDNYDLFVTYRDSEMFLSHSGTGGKLNDDFSLSWELPRNMLGIVGKQISACDEDGEYVAGYYGGNVFEAQAVTRLLLEFAVRAYPKKLGRVEIIYSMPSYDEESPLVINLSNITVREAGTALRPATLIEIGNYKTTLTLAEGEFKAGTWYFVTRRNPDPYEPEDSGIIETDKKIYMADQSGKSCTFDNFFGYMGGGPRTGISIQEITISGDAESGFEITLTPESAETFEVVEQ